jgi:hypothetical protein
MLKGEAQSSTIPMLISETNITSTRRYRLVSSLESLKFRILRRLKPPVCYREVRTATRIRSCGLGQHAGNLASLPTLGQRGEYSSCSKTG